MSDVFLVLAQAPAGLSCFLVPRVLDDGTRNTFALQRLKDKLGNRSNASSEVELDGTCEPAAVAAFTAELDLARGADRRLDAAISSTVSGMQAAADPSDQAAAQSGARAFAEQLATTLQASLLTRFAPAYLSEAFVASRLGGAHGHTFGTLPNELVDPSAGKVIARSFPA